MKKKFFTLSIITLITGAVLISCQSSTKKEEAAQDNVEDARENLEDAKDELTDVRKEATQEEWETFKTNTNATISENEIRIAKMKNDFKKTGKSIDEEYVKKIEDLEQKNNEIKIKIENYRNDSKSDWKSFKKEYNRDMDELGEALKNLTVNNK